MKHTDVLLSMARQQEREFATAMQRARSGRSTRAARSAATDRRAARLPLTSGSRTGPVHSNRPVRTACTSGGTDACAGPVERRTRRDAASFATADAASPYEPPAAARCLGTDRPCPRVRPPRPRADRVRSPATVHGRRAHRRGSRRLRRIRRSLRERLARGSARGRGRTRGRRATSCCAGSEGPRGRSTRHAVGSSARPCGGRPRADHRHRAGAPRPGGLRGLLAYHNVRFADGGWGNLVLFADGLAPGQPAGRRTAPRGRGRTPLHYRSLRLHRALLAERGARTRGPRAATDGLLRLRRGPDVAGRAAGLRLAADAAPSRCRLVRSERPQWAAATVEEGS
jgi:hypothetical protein